MSAEEIRHEDESMDYEDNSSVLNKHTGYKLTKEYKKHKEGLPPFPRSYSSHPINEIHMKIQGCIG